MLRINRPIRSLDSLEARIAPATLPTNFSENSIGVVSSGTAMEFSPDGKLFALEQTGAMRVFTGSGTVWTQASANFFSTATISVNSSGERGLLGIAFDPNYATNHYLYVYYTATSPAIHNRVSRFTADVNVSYNQATPGSEAIIMDLENLSATNHNGGAIHFGPDGKLYVAVGENANSANAQSISNRLGKMLRLNPVPGDAIPNDNPTSFPNIAGSPTGNNRAIWAVGLRNPYTFAFQPGTGRMYINDVGQNTYEEIDVGTAGVNYGWGTVEGPSPAGVAGMTYPIVYYHHSNTALASPTTGYTGIAIVGGAFYNSTNYTFPSDYQNDYFFGDEVSSFIKRYDYTSNTVIGFATGTGNAADIKIGPDGALYYLSRANSNVMRVRYTAAIAPYIVTHPANKTVTENGSVTFSVVAGGSGTLAYQWQRNNVDIGGATASSYTFNAALADNGATYRVVVSNGTAPAATSNSGTLTVNPLVKVNNVTFGDGTNQRSLVKQIVVTFSESVTFMGSVASAFTLFRSGTGGATGNVALTANPASGPASSVTITFSGSLSQFGSLVDGFYNFTIDAAQVSGAGGALDGNNDGTPGGSYSVTGNTTNKYYRLFGDSDGDATVLQEPDFNAFRTAFNAGPSSIFDFDNSGDVLQSDFNAIRARFNTIP